MSSLVMLGKQRIWNPGHHDGFVAEKSGGRERKASRSEKHSARSQGTYFRPPVGVGRHCPLLLHPHIIRPLVPYHPPPVFNAPGFNANPSKLLRFCSIKYPVHRRDVTRLCSGGTSRLAWNFFREKPVLTT